MPDKFIRYEQLLDSEKTTIEAAGFKVRWIAYLGDGVSVYEVYAVRTNCYN